MFTTWNTFTRTNIFLFCHLFLLNLLPLHTVKHKILIEVSNSFPQRTKNVKPVSKFTLLELSLWGVWIFGPNVEGWILDLFTFKWNIAKGTMDPKFERFHQGKSYHKLIKISFGMSTKHQPQSLYQLRAHFRFKISTKIQLNILDRASESWPSFSIHISTKLQVLILKPQPSMELANILAV